MRSIYTYTVSPSAARYPIQLFSASIRHMQETVVRAEGRTPVHQILWIVEGHGRLVCDGQTYSLAEGTAFYLAVGKAAAYYDEGGLVSGFLTVKGDTADALGALAPNGMLLLQGIDVEWYTNKTRQIMEAYCAENLGKGSALCYAFFVEFLSQTAREETYLDGVLSYLHTHFSEKLTLEMLAKRACVSVSKLCHDFRAQYGKTVFACLMEMRLQYAQNVLLSDRRIRIGELAEESGFGDVGYFCRSYKSRYGKTPAEEQGRK